LKGADLYNERVLKKLFRIPR